MTAPDTTTQTAFWRGARDCGPFVLVAAPFGFLFGVLGTEAGLNILQILGFSIVVIAGAAQLTALQLMLDQAPTVIVLLSAVAVNLRMAMYSASLATYLGPAALWKRAFVAYMNMDQTFAISTLEFETRPEMSVSQRISYFFGSCLPIVPTWYVATLLGALLGQQISTDWSLEFLVPLAFLSMVAPALRTPAHIAAMVASVVLALVFSGLPFSLGLMPAGIGAMIVGAEVERRMARS